MTSQSTPKFFRFAHAEVDLCALAGNYKAVQRHAGPNVRIMAMVKADAYGHGAIPVSRKLIENGVASLGVATVEEGLELRESGIDVPVIVMGGLMGMGAPASGVMISAGLTPVIHSADVVKPLDIVAKSLGKRVGVHLKIDTGMTRLGIRPESLNSVLSSLKESQSLFIEGVMTHFASADDPEYTAFQMDKFMSAKKAVESAIGPVPEWHTSNSQAIIRRVGLEFGGAKQVWARPGIILYGGMERKDSSPVGGIKPVMSLMSKLMLIKSVPAETKVSYGGTFTTKRRSRLGLIPLGYADGYPRSLSDKAYVLAGGKRAPVVGRVTMDMIIVDVTDIPEASVGDEVALIGAQGAEEITACDLAAWSNTISYEIFTRISARVPRVYKNTGQC